MELWDLLAMHKIERATVCAHMTDYEYLMLLKQRNEIGYFFRQPAPDWLLGDVEPIDSMGVKIFSQEYNVVYLRDRSGWLYIPDAGCDCGRVELPLSEVYNSRHTQPSRAHFFFWMSNYE
jgi:hypothetical protein